MWKTLKSLFKRIKTTINSFKKSLSTGGAIAVEVSVNATHTHGDTGRQNAISGPDAEAVTDWIKCKSSKELLKHGSAKTFRRKINGIPTITEEQLILYRGRFRAEDMYPVVESVKFGPPDISDKVEAGRYNNANAPVLYLSSSEQGVFHELKRDGKPVKDLFCQKYHLPASKLNLADFSANCCDDFINLVFGYAERGIQDGQINREDYTFSQVVATIIQGGGFDGMLVPGTRGGSKYKYNNVVIFSAKRYLEWIDSTSKPKCIDVV